MTDKEEIERIRGSGCIIPGGRIAVDRWVKKTSAKHFFLTHCHSDHMTNLTTSWRLGPIYCSPISARLLTVLLNIRPDIIRPLELNEIHEIDDFSVTLLPANHCPGAVMFLFKSDCFGTILCTGDFRFDDTMKETFKNEFYLKNLCCQEFDRIFLDNTYLDSRPNTFPSRQQATEQMIEIIRKNESAIVYIGLNKLGKESLIAELANRLQWKEHIEVSELRQKVIEAIEEVEPFSTPCGRLSDILITLKQHNAILKTSVESNNNNNFQPRPRIRLCNARDLGTRIEESLLSECSSNGQSVIGLHPSMLPFVKPRCNIAGRYVDRTYLIPYSDHCSSTELIDFLARLTFAHLTPICNTIAPERLAQLMRLSVNKIRPKNGLLIEECTSSCTSSTTTSTETKDKINSNESNKTSSIQTYRRSILRVRKVPPPQPTTPVKRKRSKKSVQFCTPDSEKKKKKHESPAKSPVQDRSTSPLSDHSDDSFYRMFENNDPEIPAFGGESQISAPNYRAVDWLMATSSTAVITEAVAECEETDLNYLSNDESILSCSSETTTITTENSIISNANEDGPIENDSNESEINDEITAKTTAESEVPINAKTSETVNDEDFVFDQFVIDLWEQIIFKLI